MAAPLINNDNFFDTATLTGGSWLTGDFSPESAKTDDMTAVMRSTGISEAATQLLVDLGRNRTIGVIAAMLHNGPRNGRWEVIASQHADLTAPVLDLDQRLWDVVVPWGSRPWGAFQWGGGISDAEAAEYGVSSYLIPAVPVRARYLLLKFKVSGSGAGFFQTPRIIIGAPMRPTWGVDFGWSVKWIDDRDEKRTRSGRKILRPGPPRRRRIEVAFPALSEAEALGFFLDLDRLVGKEKGVLFMLDPANVRQRHRLTVYGQQPDTADHSQTNPNDYRRSLVLEEIR